GPDPALPWARKAEASELSLALRAELGLKAFLKTSGGRGMHVVVPLDRYSDWDCARTFAQGVTQRLGREQPARIACKMGAQNRVGRIFVDYLRNQRGASTVAAYSVRARPGLGVSLPVSLDEVQRLEGADQWRLDNVRAYLAEREDPWAAYAHTRQRLTRRLLEQLRDDS
ncbi:MAG TPA: ATP-dependent DNA ligase, partial [Pseudomonas sp.]|nr:ATP-dependent DNA ligase [Pseudomonas sp.]